MAEELETASEARSAVTMWRERLTLASKEEENWRKGGRKIVERYRDEKRKSGRKFNIFFSNVETLKPAVYSNTPQPDVRRRFRDPDPVAREAAEVLERALSVTIDSDPEDDDSFDATMEAARDDMLQPGRGVVRVNYEADFERVTPETEAIRVVDDVTGEAVTVGQRFILDGEEVEPEFDDADARTGPFVERKIDERVWAEYVFWEDIRIGPTRSWGKAPWIAFRHYMNKDQLKENFGEAAQDVPLTATKQIGKGEDERHKPPADVFKLAQVWEIFNKDGREVIWISEGHDKELKREDDPLNLRGFYPAPRPLYAIKTNESMVPVPEFTQYQDQADQLDEISERIRKLTAELKSAGLYDATVKEIVDLKNARDGEILPVDTADKMRSQGGLAGSIFMLPIEQIARVLLALMDQRERLKQEIYELINISDIMRGTTRADETLGAQKIKAGFGQRRMATRQKPMERFARDTLRLMAELMAENFSRETFERMTGREVSEEVMALLREDRLRGFRIDIETDSTVQPDAELQKQEAVDMLSSIAGYLEQAAGIGQAAPQTIPMLMELLKFGIRRGFKIGRTLEDQLEEMAEQLAQGGQQPQGPDPAVLELEQKGQLEARKQDQDARVKMRGQDIDAAVDRRGQDLKARTAA